jgi:hypothetical protein
MTLSGQVMASFMHSESNPKYSIILFQGSPLPSVIALHHLLWSMSFVGQPCSWRKSAGSCERRTPRPVGYGLRSEGAV